MFLSLFRSFSLKKFILVLLVFLIGFSVVTPVFADDSGVQGLITEFCTRRDSPVVNLEQWYSGKCHGTPAQKMGFSNIILLDAYDKLAGSEAGGDLKPILEKVIKGNILGIKPEELQQVRNSSGIIGLLSGFVGSIYQTSPASSVEYLADVRNNIASKNIISPAFAATSNGYGFESLQALLPVWKAFRNLTYFLFTLVFVIYGFMMMFRMKINAQTVVSIQTALPKIIVTLVAITFSYAIAGFMIDMLYVIIGMLFSLLQHTDPAIIQYDNNAKFLSGMTVGLWGPFIAMFVHLASFSLIAKLLAFIIPQAIASVVVGAAVVGGTILTAGGIWIIILIIVAVVLLFIFFKIFWMLLKASVTLSLKIMFAPILLLKGIMPGSHAFSEWIMGIIAELSVFATTIFGFLFAFYFIGPVTLFGDFGLGGAIGNALGGNAAGLFEIGKIPSQGNLWIGPPLSSGLGTEASAKFALLGFGIFIMIPKFSEMVYKSLKQAEFKFGGDLQQGLSYGMFANWAASEERYFGLGGSASRRARAAAKYTTGMLKDTFGVKDARTGKSV